VNCVDEAVDMLKFGFVQGKLNENTGNYRTLLLCMHAACRPVFTSRCAYKSLTKYLFFFYLIKKRSS
jgi:hypothetical protein